MSASAFLATLLRSLRRRGVPVSPGEAIDAAQALALVSLEDRALVEAALGATLAKSRTARAALGDALEEALPAVEWRSAPGEEKRRRRSRGRPGGVAGAAGASRAPLEGRTPAFVVPPASRPGERQKRERREGALARLEKRESRGDGEKGEGEGDRRRRRRLDPVRGDGPKGQGPDRDLLRRDLRGALGPEEDERWERLLERLLAAVRAGAARRRRVGRKGALDAHRLFRRAVATGGVPFSLPRRERRRRPLRLLLLVDVSWSARRAARAFLVLARALARCFRETRVLLFVDRPVEVRGAQARGEGLRRAARPATAAPGLRPGARSDYAKALFALQSGFAEALRRDALLVVLGDARSNFLPAEAWCLEEIAARTAGVVWLVPEPRERWGEGDSAILEYAPCCDVVREGATLEDLAGAVAALARVR